MSFSEQDRIWMQRALNLATRGRGYVSPNPLVGCVIVSSEGNIIGEGYHQRFGKADRKSTRLNSSHVAISYAVFCLKKKKHHPHSSDTMRGQNHKAAPNSEEHD